MKDFKTKQQMMQGHYCWGGKVMKKAKGGYAEGGMRSESTQMARAKRDLSDAYEDEKSSYSGAKNKIREILSPINPLDRVLLENERAEKSANLSTALDRKKRAESETGGYKKGGMAKGGNWIAGAVKNKGALHRDLGVPEGKKIPESKLNAAMHSSNPKTAKRARLAKTLKSFHKG